MSLGAVHWLEGNTHSIVAASNPEPVLDALEHDRVTHVMLVPATIQLLLDHPAMKKPRELRALQTILYSGAPISEAVLKRAMAALPGVAFVRAYGMTELAPWATVNPACNHTAHGRELGKPCSAGRAGLCIELRIVGGEGREVPRGTVGEVVVRGPSVMQGYWNQPELTARAVRDGWMHTGDHGRMDEDGFLFIADPPGVRHGP
jgi:long-chain acyl-CoA synthetase